MWDGFSRTEEANVSEAQIEDAEEKMELEVQDERTQESTNTDTDAMLIEED